jgi:GDP-L-fucose synthase
VIPDMQHKATALVAGGRTFIGAAIVRELHRLGHATVGEDDEPDLTERHAVDAFFDRHRPSLVFLAAGRILGIGGNQRHPADLMRDNLLVATHVIDAAQRFGARKLLYLSSGCSYPRLAPQPMRPEAFMTGPLEPTSEYYATAKLAGMKLCEAYRRQYGATFITAVPANPFGVGDDFDPDDAHVIGALMRRMHDAKEAAVPAIEIWGTGQPRRDFLYIDDLGSAAVHVMEKYDGAAPINLTAGQEISIHDLATVIAEIIGYRGEIRFDASRPDGMPLKVFDGAPLAALGWRPRRNLRQALEETYTWFVATHVHREVRSA